MKKINTVITDKDKIDALRHGKREIERHFKRHRGCMGVCYSLPDTPAGDYLRQYIEQLLGTSGFVSRWVLKKVYGSEWNAERVVGVTSSSFWQEQFYLYRLRWIDHLINQIKEG